RLAGQNTATTKKRDAVEARENKSAKAKPEKNTAPAGYNLPVLSRRAKNKESVRASRHRAACMHACMAKTTNNQIIVTRWYEKLTNTSLRACGTNEQIRQK
ncbi:unnamed protein product, partial [Ectocarpus sp. 6 AP-2014]